MDSSLANLRDREAQTLQLSSEVARLSAQQGDIEQQMRQVVRQRDLAQGQEDQLRSQVVGLQSSASLVPQLQSQIEVWMETMCFQAARSISQVLGILVSRLMWVSSNMTVEETFLFRPVDQLFTQPIMNRVWHHEELTLLSK